MMPTGLNELKTIIQYQDLAKSVDPLIYTHTQTKSFWQIKYMFALHSN